MGRFKQQFTKLFCGNEQTANLFILFLALVIQKPFHETKVHIIIRNMSFHVAEKILSSILHKKSLVVTDILNLTNIPPCDVCLINQYEEISVTECNRTKFFPNRVFKIMPLTCENLNKHNLCHAISIYSGNEHPILLPRANPINEIILNSTTAIQVNDLNVIGLYDYLMNLDLSIHNNILELLSKITIKNNTNHPKINETHTINHYYDLPNCQWYILCTFFH